MATLWFVVLNSWQYPPGSQFDAWTVFGVFVAAAGCLVWDIAAGMTLYQVIYPSRKLEP